MIDDFGDVYGILLAITGEGYRYQDMQDYADYLTRELVLVEGVGKVVVGGQREEQVLVEISRTRLASLGISPDRIFGLLQTQNTVNPAGKVRVGDEYIRIYPTGEFPTGSGHGEFAYLRPGGRRAGVPAGCGHHRARLCGSAGTPVSALMEGRR